MDLKKINTLVSAVLSTFDLLLGIRLKRLKLKLRYGKRLLGKASIVIKLEGDISGTLYLDLSPRFADLVAHIYKGRKVAPGDILSSITSFANNLAAVLYTEFRKRNLDVKVYSPFVHIPKGGTVIPDDVACIDMDLLLNNYWATTLSFTDPYDSYFNSRSIVFFGIPNEIIELAVFHFISRGMITFNPTSVADLFRIVEAKKVDVLFINDEMMAPDPLAFIERIKVKSFFKSFSLIIYSSKERDWHSIFRNLADIKFLGSIPQSKSPSEVMEILKNYISLKEAISGKERRKHVRIYFNPGEKAECIINVPNSSEVISARITNISIGGMTVFLNDEMDAPFIRSNTVLHGVRIRIDNLPELLVHAIVTSRKGRYVGLKFTEVRENFVKVLAKFIHERIARD